MRLLGASPSEIVLVVFLATLVIVGTKLPKMGDAIDRWLERRR